MRGVSPEQAFHQFKLQRDLSASPAPRSWATLRQVLRLDAADLDALEIAVIGNRLPDTTGFFFDESGPDRIEEDIAFIAKARAALEDSYFVYYES